LADFFYIFNEAGHQTSQGKGAVRAG
jgi:hypothetical protein